MVTSMHSVQKQHASITMQISFAWAAVSLQKKIAVEFTKIFLTTEFEGGRHQRRIDQIAAIEQETNKKLSSFR